jgi:hypothetical protein
MWHKSTSDTKNRTVQSLQSFATFCFFIKKVSKHFFLIRKWKWKVKWAEVIYRVPQTFPERNNPERNNPERKNPECKNPKCKNPRCKNPPKPKNPESGAKLGEGGRD